VSRVVRGGEGEKKSYGEESIRLEGKRLSSLPMEAGNSSEKPWPRKGVRYSLEEKKGFDGGRKRQLFGLQEENGLGLRKGAWAQLQKTPLSRLKRKRRVRGKKNLSFAPKKKGGRNSWPFGVAIPTGEKKGFALGGKRSGGRERREECHYLRKGAHNSKK